MGSQAGNGGLYGAEITTGRAGKARVPLRTFIEPAREVPVMHKTDVLVVGGGPAGTTAAIAAARLGARVMLVERYNHLGGLSTGGLVIWIDRMTDWDGKLVIRGLGRELLDRLPKDAIYGPNPGIWGTKAPDEVAKWRPRFSAHHDTVTWAPMIDPEQLKAVSLQAAREAGVELIFHAWASNAIIEGGRVSGVIFESKQGRFGISATVVVDTTGDGDIFAAAGEDSSNDVDASNIHQCINTSWLWGGVDIARWLAFRTTAEFDAFSKAGRSEIGLFEMPVPTWRNDVAVFMGPRFAGYNAIDVQDLTEVELRSRDKMMELLAYYRKHAPGFESAWIILTAPQIGVRQSRRLIGRGSLTREAWQAGVVHADEIGISPSLAPKFQNVSVPYSSLLPRNIRGLVVAGRHMSTDASSHTFMREIPQCWLTGHAAGAAAALAANGSIELDCVSVPALQGVLEKQGVLLRTSVKSSAVESASVS